MRTGIGCAVVDAALHWTGTASLYPNGDDPVVVLDELSYLGNRGRQRAVDDGNARPDRVEELRLGHHLAGVKEQRSQDLERLRFDLDGGAADAELPGGLIQLALAESPEMPHRGLL